MGALFVGATAAGGGGAPPLPFLRITSTTSSMPILHLHVPIGGGAKKKKKKVNVADLRRWRIMACSNFAAAAAAAASSSSSTGGSASELEAGEVKKGGRGELQQLVGAPELELIPPPTQPLNLIWAYINSHNLQDPGKDMQRKPATEFFFLRWQFVDQMSRAILFVILLTYVARTSVPLLIRKNQILSISPVLESTKEKKGKKKTKYLAERAKQKDVSEAKFRTIDIPESRKHISSETPSLEEQKETSNLAEWAMQKDDLEAKRKLKRAALSFRMAASISLEAESRKLERGKDEVDGKSEEPAFVSFFRGLLIGRRFYDPHRWKRPMRYIENKLFSNAVRNEQSQYYFQATTSDGKTRLAFTHPPSLSTFWDMLEQNLGAPLVVSDPYKEWVDANQQRWEDLTYEYVSRIKLLDEGACVSDVLKKKTRFYYQEDSKETKEKKKKSKESNEEQEEKYLPKWCDPSLDGPYRVTIRRK